jgi:hypothetical protein
MINIWTLKVYVGDYAANNAKFDDAERAENDAGDEKNPGRVHHHVAEHDERMCFLLHQLLRCIQEPITVQI